MTIKLNIPDNNVEADVKKEIALFLYDKEFYSLGKASELAGITKDEFMKFLRGQNVHIKYSIDDVKDDLSNLSKSILNDSGK